MKFKEAKIRITSLKQKLTTWNYEYYVLDNPSVSDNEYDQTMQELISLEEEFPDLKLADSPTQRVGGQVSKKFEKYSHTRAMLSLGNAFNYDDLIHFDEQVKELTDLAEIAYVCELKIDGLSISLVYNDGLLETGATRGDGSIGENVTNNIKTIGSIPLKISNSFSTIVRGEVFLSKKDFAAINQEKSNNDETLFANPRNAAAGTLRQLDSKIVSQRNLDAFLYYYFANDKTVNTQLQALEKLKELKFKINPNYRLCQNITEVWDYIQEFSINRDTLDYEIDGIVIKVNDFSLYNTIGYTAKNPKWAIAYKFPAEKVITEILEIFSTVGRTGKITYNAKLTPVRIAGTVVKAATLHNAEFIIKKDLRIGDYVEIKKAGDIIPEVVDVLLERRQKKLKKWVPITKCPECHTLLEKLPDEVDQYCINNLCNKKIIKTLEHFISRNAMNIVGINEKIVERLYELYYLTSFSDLYKLDRYKQEIIDLKGFGQKSWDNMWTAIQASKNNSLERLIFGIGIRHVGEKTAKILAKSFLSLSALYNATIEDFIRINDLGPTIAQSIIDFFQIKNNMQEVEQLIALDINTKYLSNKNTFALEKLANLKFVITGTLSKPREEIKKLIEDEGGIISESISSKTSYLVVGENPGNKFLKAQQLNVKIITETELEQLLSDKM